MILLDTCTLLWLAASPNQLSNDARELLSSHRGRILVSAISAFEIGIKHRKGKLKLPMPPNRWFHEAVAFHGLREVPVSGEIAAKSTLLPDLHADPCDRILIATAQIGGWPLLTPDHLIRQYPDLSTAW